tara:strand:+ start:54 stop:638 length:585 start_codon:yes stop_codon:yes gene_type:complete
MSKCIYSKPKKKYSKQQIVDYWKENHFEYEHQGMGTDWDRATDSCWRCGYFTDHLEKCHIIPDALDGDNEPHNLVLLCRKCHRHAPDFNNSEYMWKWIKAEQALGYEDFNSRRVLREYKKMFGEPVSKPEWIIDIFENKDKDKKSFNKLKSIIRKIEKKVWKKAGQHGGTISYSTQACVHKEMVEELSRIGDFR